jgi:hypothetical protein
MEFSCGKQDLAQQLSDNASHHNITSENMPLSVVDYDFLDQKRPQTMLESAANLPIAGQPG